MKLLQLIEKHWYIKSNPLLTILLTPFSIIYGLIVRIRTIMFQVNLKSSTKLSVPVVVVGNIGVGGAGKTPLTKHIAEELLKSKIQVGIILRGYKGSSKTPRIVYANDDSLEVGDEALIYAQAGYRVAIGSKRVDAGKTLLAHYPDTQLLLADDGLQHYYLQRDFEICVIDSSRIFGNKQLLPLGPLRESVSRLHSVNAIVINGDYNSAKLNHALSKYRHIPTYYQQLEFIHLYNPVLKISKSIQDFQHEKVLLMAAIGNPRRFFDYLAKLGLNITETQFFPDHYHYQAVDINPEYAIITTEKDYTKLAKFNAPNIWIAVVKAKLNNELLISSIKNLVIKGS